MIVSFNNLAGAGLVKDVNSELLPVDPFVWTEATNVRFKDGSIRKINGSEEIVSTPIPPHYIAFISPNNEMYFILVFSRTEVQCYYSGAWTNITRTSGNYQYSNVNWQHTVINTFPIFNNNYDRPQVWKPAMPGTPLIDLPSFPDNMYCGIIRAFKSHLIAGNITDNATNYPSRILWSGSALPGELPTTWDISDITNDAGYMDLSDTPGEIIDMKLLGDNLVIYKKKAMYLMYYIGGNNIFSIKQIFNNVGAVSKDCVCDVKGGHLVVTEDDIIIHDGNSYKSIVDQRLRQTIFNNIDQISFSNCHVVPNYKQNEVWLCIPTFNALITSVYIFNYETNVWTTRTVLPTECLSVMPLDISTASEFNLNPDTFNSASYIYDTSKYYKNKYFMVEADLTHWKLVLLDSTSNQEVGVNMLSTVERKNINLSDDESIKIVKRIYPKMSKLSGTSNIVNFYIGTQMMRNEPIIWSPAMPFDIVTGYKLDFFATGRWISIRIESTTDIEWTMENFELEISSGGKW
jgi:hypothetical protein